MIYVTHILLKFQSINFTRASSSHRYFRNSKQIHILHIFVRICLWLINQKVPPRIFPFLVIAHACAIKTDKLVDTYHSQFHSQRCLQRDCT